MIKKENFDKTSAWPFVEAKKMLRERKSFIEKKGKIILQTGYGPSGLPHIGTFGEVARTSMIVNALKHLTDLPTEIITFSDDMDGLRKVPDNVPQKELLEKNLHKPLTNVPDPFQKFNSFGEHNNEMLKNFLDSFKFKNVKLLKIDAEGYEPEVLKGSKDTLNEIQYISVDYGNERGREEDSTICEVTNFLYENKFKLISDSSYRKIGLFKNTNIKK